MNIAEYTVWTLMTGGLLSLVLLAMLDTLVTRSLGALRNVLLIISIGGLCVLMSGLPEAIFPALPQRLGMMLQAGLGPLNAALGLRFMNIWLDGKRGDPLNHQLTQWGSMGMLVVAPVLMLLATQVAPGEFAPLLRLTAAVNAVTVVLLIVVSVRATWLGDPLARWMVLDCLFLMGMSVGLYLKALNVEGFGLGTWIFTATCSVVFLLILMVLIIVRNRANRQLARLTRLETGNDPATGLPTRMKLLSEVDHVFWRTGRLHGKCVVICVYLHNLYALGEALGRTGENQIVSATATRIRRAVGFRCVVGLYHPRCFVIVISTDREREVTDAVMHRIKGLVDQPLPVVGSNDTRHMFTPQTGMAMLTVLPDHAEPQTVLNEVEHLAMQQARELPPAEDLVETVW